MKVSAAPQFTLNKVPNNNKPSVPTPPKPDQVELGGGQPPQEPKISHTKIAVAGASVLGGAALGAAAGLHGGILAGALATCTIPALAVAGALLGGVAFEALGPSSSENRAIGGAIVGQQSALEPASLSRFWLAPAVPSWLPLSATSAYLGGVIFSGERHSRDTSSSFSIRKSSGSLSFRVMKNCSWATVCILKASRSSVCRRLKRSRE